MIASILDLRRRMGDVLRALDRNEEVTIMYRGKKKAVLIPAAEKEKTTPVSEHSAFGMWAERDDLKNVPEYVRSLRKGRF